MGVLWAMSLPGLVVLLVVLAVAGAVRAVGEQPQLAPVAPQARGHAGVRRPGSRSWTRSSASGKRHELDERNHSLMMREDEDDGAPPLMKVDLDRGRIVMNRPDYPIGDSSSPLDASG